MNSILTAQSIDQLVSATCPPTDALYVVEQKDAFDIPPLPSYPSTKSVFSITVRLASLCPVSAGSGRCVLLRIQSPKYSPSEGVLLEVVVINTTLQIHVIIKGKEDSVDIDHGLKENSWNHFQFVQTRSVKRGIMVVSRNGKEIFSGKMLMPPSDGMMGAHVTLCSEGFHVDFLMNESINVMNRDS